MGYLRYLPKVFMIKLVMKLCKRCNIEKNLDQFTKHSIMKDGLRSYCKECAKKDYDARHYEPIMEGTLNCNMCKEEFPVEEFYLNKNNTTGRERICKPCSYLKSKKHRESGYKFPRVYDEKAKNAQREGAHKRRLLKKFNTDVELPSGWRLAVLEYYGYKCMACGATERLEIDHVIPLHEGGADSFENMQPLCIYHNRSKHIKIIDYRDGDIFTLEKAMTPISEGH